MAETHLAETQWIEVLLELAPGLVLGALLVALLGVYILGRPTPEDTSHRDGSYLLPSVLIDFWYWLVNPLIDRLHTVGVRPNHITLFSLSLAVLSAVALGAGYLMAGCWLLVATASCDLLDGLLARRTNTGSQAGAFLDSFADRVAEGIVFAGIAFYGAGGVLTWVALWAMLASVLVSYARARGEALGVDCKVGLMQRPERLLLLIVTLFFAPVGALFWEPGAAQPVYHLAVGGIGLLALLSTVTAARRAVETVRALGTDMPADPDQPDPGQPDPGQPDQDQPFQPLQSSAGATQ
jgi:phosphatidylglycerophosphate synthase